MADGDAHRPPGWVDDLKLWIAREIKREKGATPTQREERGWGRHERRERARHVDAAYRAVPKKRWLQWSGRQHKTVAEQAATYGLPIGGASIDLAELAPKLHDFLARIAPYYARWITNADEDALLLGEATPSLERLRKAQAELTEFKLKQLKRDVVPREEVHQKLARTASIVRGCGDALQRQFGPEAHQILEDALNDVDRQIAEWLAGG